jgi:hypothetical protein
MTEPTTVAFDPTSAEQREDPFTVLAHARQEQPVFYAPELRLWVVTRHDDVLTVLKDHRTFSSVGALTSATVERPSEVTEILAGGHPEMPYIIEVDPPLHDRIRGLVARAPGSTAAAPSTDNGSEPVQRGTSRSSCVTWWGPSSSIERAPRRRIVRRISPERISIARSTPARPPAIRP